MDSNVIDLLQEYDQYVADGKSPSHSWMSKLLKELRKSKVKENVFIYLVFDGVGYWIDS